MSIILAADTSTPHCTVALWRDGALLAESTLLRDRLHSERLIAMMDSLLTEADASLDDVDLLAISCGPGSFTGLRVGVSTFKGLALGLDKPLAGVPTLDALARVAGIPDGIVCTVIDARMKEVFGATYRFTGGHREKLCSDFVGPVEELIAGTDSPVYFLGDGADVYRERILGAAVQPAFAPPEINFPRAAAVAAEADAMAQEGVSFDANIVEPLYLRKSQAEQARDAKRATTTVQ